MNRGLIPRNDQVLAWLKNVGTLLDDSFDMYVSICVKRGSRARQVMNGAVFEALVIDPQNSDLRK